MRRIAVSGAFDGDWYVRRYRDVAAAGIDPLLHYVRSGCREGRFPNPIFDTDWYLAAYHRGDTTGNALCDYLRRGRREGRRPNRWLDPRWYRRRAGVGPAIDVMAHYRAAGREAVAPGPDIDLADLARSCADHPPVGDDGTPLGFLLNTYRVRGAVDVCTSHYVSGWASRRAGPAIVVTIIVNGRAVGGVAPWIARPDVEETLGITATGFCFRFPARLAHGDIVALHDELGQTLIGSQTMYRVANLGDTTAIYANRAAIAATFLTGRGVEIGAFTQPTDIPPDRHVAFYDRYPAAELRKVYDRDCGRPLMEPDHVGDGETLDGLADAGFDFLVANHVIEHLQDPIRFLRSVAAKLAPGGRAMIAAPDKRYCMDNKRSITSFDHLVEDHENGAALSQRAHHLQFVEEAGGITGQAALDWLETTDMDDIRFHYHVWDADAFVAFFQAAIERYAIPLTLIHTRATVHDVIVVVERAGDRRL